MITFRYFAKKGRKKGRNAKPQIVDGPFSAGSSNFVDRQSRLWTTVGVDKLLALLETTTHSAFEDTSLGRDVGALK